MNILEVVETTRFRRDIRQIKRRGKNLDALKKIVGSLVRGEELPPRNRDHALTGNWRGHRECHINPDWLLIYCINEDEKVIELVRTGSHSDLF